MKFEFIEKEKPKKIWVNEKEAEKYLQALIMANPICFREYIEKVRADAIDDVKQWLYLNKHANYETMIAFLDQLEAAKG